MRLTRHCWYAFDMSFFSFMQKRLRWSYWNAALLLIAVNIGVFLLTSMNYRLTQYLALNPLLMLRQGMWWQVFTYQFVHGGTGHLLSNMIGLFFFGAMLERHRSFGSSEFLLFYLVSGTLSGIASFFVYWITGTWFVFLMGASGAVFAVLFVYAVVYPRSTIYLMGFVPVPAPLLVIGYAGIEVFSLISGSNSGIAHGTHLFGFGFAWLYCRTRLGIKPLQAWRNM